MKKNLEIADTNILIRFLTNDTPEQAKQIEALFKKAKPRSLYIPDLVVAEIIYVLLSYYETPKKDVIEKMNILVEYDKFYLNLALIKKSLEIYSKHNISFVDSYLLAKSADKNISTSHTFDKNMLKILKTRDNKT